MVVVGFMSNPLRSVGLQLDAEERERITMFDHY